MIDLFLKCCLIISNSASNHHQSVPLFACRMPVSSIDLLEDLMSIEAAKKRDSLVCLCLNKACLFPLWLHVVKITPREIYYFESLLDLELYAIDSLLCNSFLTYARYS